MYISIHKVCFGAAALGLLQGFRGLPCLEKCRYLLHMSAICCIWPLEPGPEPQMARNGCSSPPRKRLLEMAARARPGAAEYSKSAARVCPGGAECSTGAARACPGAAACSKSAARNGRSKSAASCSSVIGLNFCSAPLCFVHVMHGFTLVIYVNVRYETCSAPIKKSGNCGGRQI